MSRVCDLEKHKVESQNVIDALRKENAKLKVELADVNERLSTHLINFERKCTQSDANLKLLNQQSKAVGEFDFNVYDEKTKQIESELLRHNKLIVNIQKAANEVKMTCQQSYAAILSPNSASNRYQVNSVDILTNESPVKKRSSVSNTAMGCNGILNTTGTSDIPESVSRGNVDIPKRQTNENAHPSYKEESFRIPVRVHGLTADIQPTDEDLFTGVTRKRTARYYLSGINSKSTRTGIVKYLEQRGVHVTYLRLFNSSNYSRFISAKLNISDDCKHLIDTENFWPIGVHCRKWMSNSEWYGPSRVEESQE